MANRLYNESSSLQRVQKGEHGLPVFRAELFELITTRSRLAPVPENRLFDRTCPPVVEKESMAAYDPGETKSP